MDELNTIAQHALGVIDLAVRKSLTPMDACQYIHQIATIPVELQRKVYNAHHRLDKIEARITEQRGH